MSNSDDTSNEEARGLSIGEEGPSGRPGFDPSPYMRQLRGRGGNQDYLDVKWRLLWLRREHPDAEILTEHVRIDEGMAIFKATVTIPTGGKATGYGSETAGDFGDFIEKAETKAIGRALNALGYGAQFSEKGDDEPTPTPAPPERRQSPPPAERASTPPAQPKQAVAQAEPAAPAAPAIATVPSQPRPAPVIRETRDSPEPREEPVPIRQPAATAERPARGPVAAARPAAPDRPARQPTPTPAPAPVQDDDDVDMADMTWTAFWAWARPLGYNKRGDIEQFLGYSIDSLTPADVRAQVREARGEG